MKNTKNGLDLQEDKDINIDGDFIMRSIDIDKCHEEALNINFTFDVDVAFGYERMSFFMAMIDYQEMKNFRNLPEVPAHLLCLAEMELRAR